MDPYSTLLPQPELAFSQPGTCLLNARTAVAVAGSAEIQELFRRFLAGLPLPADGPSNDPANTTQTTLSFAAASDHAPGAFRVEVTESGVEISAGGFEGAVNALTTLRQLMPAHAWRREWNHGGGWAVPCGTVADRPEYGWRGAMLDVARHFFPKRTILRYVDLLAAHRFNRLHLHLADDQGWRVESRRHPRLHEVGSWRPSTRLGPDGVPDGTPHGGYYTLDDLAEISAYARSRGITLVPEIDVPGHTSALRAAYPELGRPGQEQAVLDTVWAGGSSLSPTRPVVAFLEDVLAEILEAVDTPYVHLGGDECDMGWWADDPVIAAEMAEHGYTDVKQMHGHFLRSLGRFLSSRGVRMVVWDEGFVTGGVLPDTIVMAWRGHEVAGRAAASHDVVRAPLFPTYFNFDQSDLAEEPRSEGGPITIDDVAAFSPAPEEWPDALRGRVLGGQFQIWSEWVATEDRLDYLAFPRACALAEVLWRGRVADPADFGRRLTVHLGRLDAMGVGYRPPAGPHPWQTGGTGVWRRSGPGRIEETKKWVESVSREP
ncbi:beta-N-acetylhexosaminidase [Planotetraspora kaengkrachanensis]|uniref:beta-N-acetylhexosaminidase n=1 Tax=Planotetraspora kaengkrachanensis TaxID=575193 RepID=A0A8J3PWA1_9ACTN|nr:beta-N-acetylhexosaminidase [Planotetraspora kaengkrachanensis]GIG82269.1 beta-N-acetylhexosaminidase [Planotetraspora kaengkrachanensis]